MLDRRSLTCRILALPFLSLFLAGHALATDFPTVFQTQSNQFFPLSTCAGSRMMIRLCGRNVNVSIPDYALVAPMTTLPMPPPFLPEPYTLKCVMEYGMPAPSLIVDTSGVSCQLLRCPESSETLCRQKLMVPGGTLLGDRIDVPVSNDVLISSPTPHNITFQEQCVYRDNQAVYQLENSNQVSCNLFPCPDARLKLCDMSIPIKGGAYIGEVQNIQMPSPFVADVFAVQCLGDGHTPPAYKIIDAAGVTCARGGR